MCQRIPIDSGAAVAAALAVSAVVGEGQLDFFRAQAVSEVAAETIPSAPSLSLAEEAEGLEGISDSNRVVVASPSVLAAYRSHTRRHTEEVVAPLASAMTCTIVVVGQMSP